MDRRIYIPICIFAIVAQIAYATCNGADFTIKDGVTTSCAGSSIGVNVQAPDCTDLSDIKLTINGQPGNNQCTPAGSYGWHDPVSNQDYCEFTIPALSTGSYDLEYEYSATILGCWTVAKRGIFQPGFQVTGQCDTSSCSHGGWYSNAVTYKLDFESEKGSPEYVMEGNTYIVYPGTTISIKDINSFAMQSSDGLTGESPVYPGLIAWQFNGIATNDDTSKNEAANLCDEVYILETDPDYPVTNCIRHNNYQGGFFLNIPNTRYDVFQSTKGFLWTSDLQWRNGGDNEFELISYGPDYANMNTTIQVDRINAVCDSPDFVCPVNNDNVCSAGSLANSPKGFIADNTYNFGIAAPDGNITQEFTNNLTTLVRLYESGRKVSYPVIINNTGSFKINAKVSIDCSTDSSFQCGIDTTDQLDIEPSMSGTFNFWILPPNINAGLVFEKEFTPTLSADMSYPGMPVYQTITHQGSVTFVDQDWSDIYCENPTAQETGIYSSSNSSLSAMDWLVKDADLYFPHGQNSYKSCCGDDSNETWSNPFYHTENDSSCYNGKTLLNCQVPGTNSSVINENGTIYVCGQGGQALNNSNANNNIVTGNYCTYRCQENRICTFANSSWVRPNEQDMGYIKGWAGSATNISRLYECCNKEKCWNGNKCVINAVNISTNHIYDNYRCIDGLWKAAVTQKTPDDNDEGYCPDQTKCLFSHRSNPPCVSSGFYDKDDYCENGTWSSRTKWIASKMADMASGDFTLYCSSQQNTLNFLDYVVGTNYAKNYVKGSTNNYCVLVSGSNIVIGTSLNDDIEAANSSFIDVLKDITTSCSGAKADDGLYHQCSSPRVWYNNRLKSVIFSKSIIQPTGTDPVTNFNYYIKSRIDNTLTKLKQGFPTEPFISGFYNRGIRTFKNVYVNKGTPKSVTAAMDGVQVHNLIAEYKGFSADICSYVDTYNQLHPDAYAGIKCYNDGSSYYVLGQGSIFSNADPAGIWTDMTASIK